MITAWLGLTLRCQARDVNIHQPGGIRERRNSEPAPAPAPETFKNPLNDDIHDHFSSDNSDISSFLRQASDQELLDLRSEARRLREEKVAQHEELLRRQLDGDGILRRQEEKELTRRQEDGDRFVRFPATGEQPERRRPALTERGRPALSERGRAALTEPARSSDLDLSSFSNKLLLDLFLKPDISRQPEPHQVQIQPIFSPPGQTVNNPPPGKIVSDPFPGQIVSDLPPDIPLINVQRQAPLDEPALDDPLALLRSMQNERQQSKRIEIQKTIQNKKPQTFTTFESVPLREDVAQINSAPSDNVFASNNARAPPSNRGQFPNFPSTMNPLREITTEKTVAVEIPKFTPERIRRIRPFKTNIGEKKPAAEKSETEEEEERRRQEAGVKRRKQLFDSAVRRRKLLDSKRKKLRTRGRKQKTSTPTPFNDESTIGPLIPTSTPTAVIEEEDDDEDQEVIIDEAIQAVLSRAVSGDVRDKPVIWAAVSAIYQFVDMQEQVTC